MLGFCKKYLIIAVLVHLSIALVSGPACGYLETITLDGKDDAGIYPGQDAFARFKVNYDNRPVEYHAVDPDNMNGQWLGGQQVFDYFSNNISYGNVTGWTLQSAGNINPLTQDHTVGESLSGLSAGTYRVSPYNGAYSYDFSWPEYTYEPHYWWKVYIKADKVYHDGNLEQEHYYILGREGVSDVNLNTLVDSYGAYDAYAATSYSCNGYCGSPESVFAEVENLYIDIPLAAGGALSFWIWDWNSIDNSRGISLNVEYVPEPSTFILLAIGFSCLLLRKGRGTF